MIKMPWSKLESKIDKLDERLDKMDVHFATYNESLKHYVMRTGLAEARIEQLHQDQKKVSSHIDRINGAAKLLASAGAITALLNILFKI